MTRKQVTPLLLLLFTMGTTAIAQDLICSNTPATPFTGSADNVEVPPGAECFLLGATVDDIKVYGSGIRASTWGGTGRWAVKKKTSAAPN